MSQIAAIVSGISVDLTQVAADLEWIASRLLEQPAEHRAEILCRFEGLLASNAIQLTELTDSPARAAGDLVIRFGVLRRDELCAVAIGACDFE